MRYEILPDPRAFATDNGAQTLQIHRPLPDPVPIGHFEEGGREVVDERVSRDQYLGRIQDACARRGDGLEVRFYDHFEEEFDASVLDALDQIRNLSLDGLRIRNPEAVGRLPKLTAFRFTPAFDMKTPKILSAFGVHRLTEFTLAGTTPMPAIDLTPLGEAQELRTLRLLGIGKNTAAIGRCAKLVELAIAPSKTLALESLNPLASLEVLKFVLGSSSSIEALGGLPALRDLSFREVRHLEALGDLQRFPALRRLQVSDQPRIAEIRVGPGNAALEHLYLYSLPALQTLSGVYALPALRSFWTYDCRLDLDWSRLPASLTHFQMVTKATKGRDAHDAAVAARGLIAGVHPDASFFYK